MFQQSSQFSSKNVFLITSHSANKTLATLGASLSDSVESCRLWLRTIVPLKMLVSKLITGSHFGWLWSTSHATGILLVLGILCNIFDRHNLVLPSKNPSCYLHWCVGATMDTVVVMLLFASKRRLWVWHPSRTSRWRHDLPSAVVSTPVERWCCVQFHKSFVWIRFNFTLTCPKSVFWHTGLFESMYFQWNWKLGQRNIFYIIWQIFKSVWLR